MHPNLSFDRAPPISVPLRFFLAAALFGVAAGILFAFHGPAVVHSRWSAEAIALTHLITAGVMLQAMTGALLQFIPVAAGGNVWRPHVLALIVQPSLVLAVLLLCAGFWLRDPRWFSLAAPIFLAAITALVVALSSALWRTATAGATLIALRIAVVGLLVTAVLGAVLAEGLARGLPLSYQALTHAHAAWGFGAWGLALIAGVSYFVVPMFHLTPPYPKQLVRWFVPLLLVAVSAWSLLIAMDAGPQLAWTGGALLAFAAMFAITTLLLQKRRRRRVNDASLYLFRFAMVSMLAAALAGVATLLGGDYSLLFGMLCLAGVFVSVINGMIYKIVPFITWLHLQNVGTSLAGMPNMKTVIPETSANRQARLHMLSVLLLVASNEFPVLNGTAGAAFAVSCAWLAGNLMLAIRCLTKSRDQIRAGGAHRGS